VSCDVAVHEPGARIISLECDYDEAVSGEKHDIASGRVVKLEVELCYIERLRFRLL
jgi:hypothetical protein